MRRFVLSLYAIVATLFSADAQITASEWLTQLRATLGSSYAWNIAVETQGESYAGYYMVEGDAYYISLGIMEVYSDGKLRYEINNERKEVVEDRVNLEACDLLSNPTRAFSFVPQEFSSEVTSATNERVTLRLTPKSEAMGIDAITLTLERSGSQVAPVAISYDYDGDAVAITLSRADVSDAKLPRWDKSAYRAYDIVSFL